MLVGGIKSHLVTVLITKARCHGNYTKFFAVFSQVLVGKSDKLLIFLSLEQVDDELEIKAYYAGHVLGAAMFHIRVDQQSLVYTVSL